MTKLISYLVILTQLLSYTPDLKAETIYQWKDEKGVIHYSDFSPKVKEVSEISIEAIPTTSFSKIEPLPFKKVKQRKYSKTPTVSLCQQTKNKITKLELKLSKKNTAAKFDTYNKELSELRWKKVKNC